MKKATLIINIIRKLKIKQRGIDAVKRIKKYRDALSKKNINTVTLILR